MATVTTLKKTGIPYMPEHRVSVLENTINFATNNQVADTVVQLFDIPAYHVVLWVGWQVTTVEGGTLTFDVGDTTTPAGFISAANGNAVGNGAISLALTEGTPNTVTGYSNGKYYGTADTIDLIPKNDADTAVIRVWAVVARVAAM